MTSPTTTSSNKQSARRLLAQLFLERGYVRQPNPTRLREGYTAYKKGTEVRLVAETRAVLTEVRAALRAVGLRPGRAFLKNGRYVQPVYGKDALEWFERAAGTRR